MSVALESADPPDVDLRASLLAMVDRWVSAPPLLALVRHFGGPWDTSGKLVRRLDRLEQFAAAAWDFRARSDGSCLERNQIEGPSLSDADERVVRDAVDALGLTRPSAPLYTSYDHVLVLGGLVRSNLWRSAYAAHLLAGRVSAPAVVGLTSFRRLSPNPTDPRRDEPAMLGTHGLPACSTEYDVLEQALRRAFDLPAFVATESGGGAVGSPNAWQRAQASSGGRRVALVAAPRELTPGVRRVTTSTSLQYWARHVETLRPGQRILLVTTCPYVRYQHLLALQHLALRRHVEVDTVGVDESVVAHGDLHVLTAVEYLQEVRSLLSAHRELLRGLGARSDLRPCQV